MMKFCILDVFAETALAGNQLAVVEDAAALDTARMQAIAREMNFSETTFITRREGRRATVRIFTPAQELPFAGHPTLGTAWLICGGQGDCVLELGAGDIPVRFADGMGWFEPPPAGDEAALDPAAAAALVGLDPARLDPDFDPCFLRCGPAFRLIGVRTLADLQAIRLNCERPDALMHDGCPFVFCRGGHGGSADYAARMLFWDGSAVREDPATGSANSAFAAYLQARGHRGEIIVEQGYEISRPARLHLRLDAPLAVGGRVQLCASGSLHL